MKIRGVSRTVLDNGLTVLTENRPNTKKAALVAGVKVGPVDEEPRLSGASHFNEHMLFKSNSHRSAREIAEDLEYAGTVINAYTTWKYTAYTARAPHQHLNTAIEVLYEAATNYSYREDEFENERQVILTEIQNFINAPDRYSLTGLFIPSLYAGTPLEKKIEGTIETMSRVTKEELAELKKRYYVPNNMVIAAAGKFDREALLAKIRELFGPLEERRVPPRDENISRTNRRRDVSETRKDITQTYMCLGYRVPGYDSQDIHAIELLSSLLSEGLSSRMYRELRDKRGIGYSVGSVYYPTGKEGIFITHIEGFDPKRKEEAQQVILDIFRDLKENPVPDREFNGTKTLMSSKYEDIIERTTERSMALLETEIYSIPYDFREKEKHIWRITQKELMEAAREYLTDDYVLTLLEPDEAA